MCKKINILSILVILAVSNFTQAESLNEKSQKPFQIIISDDKTIKLNDRELSLSEAIKKAIESNPDIFVLKHEASMADADQVKFDSQYSPYLQIETGVSTDKYPELLYTKYAKQIDTFGNSVAIAKKYSTGTDISAGVSHSNLGVDTGQGLNIDVVSPVLFFNIEQDLLKNAFGYKDKRQKDLLSKATKIKEEVILYNISRVALGVIMNYWQLANSVYHLENVHLNLLETEKVREIGLKRQDFGLSEKFEIHYWNSLVAKAKTDVLLAEQTYNETARSFLRSINQESSISSPSKIVLSSSLPVIDVDESIRMALNQRSDYYQLKEELEIAKIQNQIATRETLPSLKAGLKLSSMDYNMDSASNAYENATKGEYLSYGLKLTLSMPLDRAAQKVEVRNSEWKILQAENKLKAKEIAIRDEIKTLAENIKMNHQLYKNAQYARKEAENYYYKMLKNLKNGRFNASNVREAILGMIQGHEGELQTLIRYNMSLLQFSVAKNDFYQTYDIDIHKYLPKK